VKESQSLRHWPYASPTARVGVVIHKIRRSATNIFLDANLFKEAFITAQQENEKLFNNATEEKPTIAGNAEE